VEEKLRDANRELDAFAGTVAHDLRAPLTPIIGFASYLRGNHAEFLSDEARDILQEIEEQAERMAAIMEDLLELSRVGKIEPVSTPLPLTPVLERVLADFAGQLLDRGFTVRVGELPALRLPETYLFELFTNLVGNILRYGAGEQPLLEIGCCRQSAGWRLFVRDHGPGIAEAEREQVFEPFYRGKAVRNTPGTGIGLATVRKIVRLAGGHIWIEETPGGGCTFIIEIPE
jgi:signal transduction histidine kinase